MKIPEGAGRLAKVVTSTKSQTINVYGEGEVEGDYEIRLRCATPALFLKGPDDLCHARSAEAAADWLGRERGFLPEDILSSAARPPKPHPKILLDRRSSR